MGGLSTRVLGFLLALLLFGCASQSGVEGIQETKGLTTRSTEFVQLEQLLTGLGYKAVGLEYEDPSTLQVFTTVFSNPLTHGRSINLVYTGQSMAYDPEQKSLTVGSTDPATIVGFITRKVPKQ